MGHLKLLCHDLGTRVVFVCLKRMLTQLCRIWRPAPPSTGRQHQCRAYLRWSGGIAGKRVASVRRRWAGGGVSDRMCGCGGAIKPQLKHKVFKNEGVAAVNYVLTHWGWSDCNFFSFTYLLCDKEKCLSGICRFHIPSISEYPSTFIVEV